MRLIACLVVFVACRPVIAQVKPGGELERLQASAPVARQAAAADPTIKNAQSPPVQAYLIEQKRRRLLSTAGLRKRIEQYAGDKSREDLIPILKEQLADLERKPLDQVGFDSAYGYEPTTGLVGYSKKVRLIENTSDGKSVILVENAALVIEGLGTSKYPSGKFFNVEKAILIGAQGPDQLFQGNKKKSYAATLVDLEAVLKSAPAGATADMVPNRPKVPGTLRLNLRERRTEPVAGRDILKVIERPVEWHVAETAIIVCDMWDDHHCKIAAQRVGAMAPRMNQVLTAARDRGVMIIHAPSDTMNIYAGTHFRTRMERARTAQPPAPIEPRLDRDAKHEPRTLPVDTSLDCDDAELGPVVRRHTRQHAGLDIVGFDGVSDNGREIYNFCRQEGIKNVVLMGVHTNYCIVARSFGIRQMVRLGMNVVLARDLTDALYDPREPPYVSHARGTEIVVEHIEKHLCPSIMSVDLTQVVPGSDGPVVDKPAEKPKDRPASTTSTTGGQVKAHYTKHEYRIPMRDGARLFTTVFAPNDAAQTYPLLMVRTQSGMRPYGPDQYPETLLGPSPLAHFAREGYIFVLQDVRGRWMSEGTFVNMRPHNPHKKTPQDIDESSDTFDTVDWLLKNVPNHNGRVGLYGTSYRGFYVVAGMIDAHPAIKAASPQAPIVDWFMGDDWRHNGALFLAHAFNYMPTIGKARPQPVQEPLYSKFDYGTPDAYDFFLRLGPLANVDARHFKGQVLFWNELLKHDTYDEFWQARVLRPHLKDVKPAVLTVGGWFDAENLFGALETHQRLESASSSSNNVFVMGPWIHGGWNGGQADGASLGDFSFGSPTADFFREQIELPFFEFHLKGKGEFKPPRAWIFETGSNKWREEVTWPPQNTKPLTLQFSSQGRLAVESGAAESGFDEYISDPARPVPSIDKVGSGMQVESLCADQRFASRRPDVLVYETGILQYDVTLAGPIVADLYVSTTGTDSDWIVKVIDVYPGDHPDPSPNPTGVRMGGYQQLVRGDVMRGRFRNSFERPEPFTPGQPAAVKFQLQDVCHTFRKGHRIMVQVQSSWFPLVDRNPQTFVASINAKDSDFQKTTQRVYRSTELPSRVTARRLP